MKIVLAVVLSIVFFALGLIGTYSIMPIIAPDTVEETTARLDSLAQAKLAEDPLATGTAQADSLGRPVSDSSSVETQATGVAVDPGLAVLRDSLQDVHQQVASDQEMQKQLLQRVEAMEAQWAALQKRFDEAKQMSGTIGKLEDNELKALLSQLELPVLEALYLEASARNRTRLLQMMPSDKASTLVSKLASPQPALASQASPAAAPGQ
jgi:hypothetical protein